LQYLNRCDAIDESASTLAAQFARAEALRRGTGRHPLIDRNDRTRKCGAQLLDESVHVLRCGPARPVKPQRIADDDGFSSTLARDSSDVLDDAAAGFVGKSSERHRRETGTFRDGKTYAFGAKINA
jgi:hypothetical protein